MGRVEPGPPLRLITIRFSHFCDKARWALDRAGLAYREEPHVPLLAWRATFANGGKRTVPVLVTPDGTLSDSTDILHWVDSQGLAPPLFPDGVEGDEVAALEEELDERLGPASRRVAYFHVLPQTKMMRRMLPGSAPRWEGRLASATMPLMTRALKRGLRIDEAGAARSREVLDEVFASVSDRLSSGRRYLIGDRFTAADLTFAALAAPVLLPPAYVDVLGVYEVPDSMTALVEYLRSTPAGQLGMRLYAEERSKVASVAAEPAEPVRVALGDQ
jgi:glutathione S-transferase